MSRRNTPHFNDATPPRDEPTADEGQLNDNDATDVKDDEESMIVHKETYMDGNVQKTREHGPMPVSQWAAYEKKNGL